MYLFNNYHKRPPAVVNGMGACILIVSLLNAIATSAQTKKARPQSRSTTVLDRIRLQGDIFAVRLANTNRKGGKSIIVLWVFEDRGTLTEYSFNPETHVLSPLGGASAVKVVPHKRWKLSLKNQSVEVMVDSKGHLIIDGYETKLSRLQSTQRLQQSRISRVGCAFCLSISCPASCCQCCACVHRCAGIPQVLDDLCCFFGC